MLLWKWALGSLTEISVTRVKSSQVDDHAPSLTTSNSLSLYVVTLSAVKLISEAVNHSIRKIPLKHYYENKQSQIEPKNSKLSCHSPFSSSLCNLRVMLRMHVLNSSPRLLEDCVWCHAMSLIRFRCPFSVDSTFALPTVAFEFGSQTLRMFSLCAFQDLGLESLRVSF